MIYRRAVGRSELTDGAKVLGVCAGVADYFGFDRDVVRAVTAIGALFSSQRSIVAYFILGFVLDQEPRHRASKEAIAVSKRTAQTGTLGAAFDAA